MLPCGAPFGRLLRHAVAYGNGYSVTVTPPTQRSILNASPMYVLQFWVAMLTRYTESDRKSGGMWAVVFFCTATTLLGQAASHPPSDWMTRCNSRADSLSYTRT